MTAYYNENDRYAAQWLRNLIAAGHIAPGDVDERSIVDVRAADLRGYAQCHFFAGIAGWALACRLAGIPDDRPVWTGSCPCQPFSAAGKRQGGADRRHLWPHWFRLIRECRPPILFGEQVAAAIEQGWLDAVCADLEGEGYATGAAALPACGIGAPHIRQRLWFVAQSLDDASSGECLRREYGTGSGPCSAASGMDDSVRDGRRAGRHHYIGDERIVAHSNGGLGDTNVPSRAASAWSDCEWLPCTDGKARPVEPGTFPLASRIPGRVGRLRAYGNAIVPQIAAEFIAASIEAIG
jgi:DNA (cytosine-5)-methyltransferase 1